MSSDLTDGVEAPRDTASPAKNFQHFPIIHKDSGKLAGYLTVFGGAKAQYDSKSPYMLGDPVDELTFKQ